jgi:hypothetical protein
MTIQLTHDEAVLVVKTKAAIGAMNDLVVFLLNHPDLLPAGVQSHIVRADYLLNSAEDQFINDDPSMFEEREAG